MPAQTVADARAFVQHVDLPAPPPETLGQARRASTFDFDAAREQAAVVGSDVISFVKGITQEQRRDLVNASMLAQLVAKKKFPEPTDLAGVLAWYDEYFTVLSQVGFVIQDKGFAEYTEGGETFEAHEAILDVAKVVLAGAPGALAVVTKTLESLQKMSDDSPWITIFHRESRTAHTARFQVSLADADEHAGLLVTLMAFGVQAQSKVTQVLFFKFRKHAATLHHHSGKVTINAPVLAGVRDDIAKKLRDFTSAFVAGLEI